MARVQDCPKCGLLNPPTAVRCDCGWDFPSRTQQSSYLEPKDQAAAAQDGTGDATLVLRILGNIVGGPG